MNSRLQGSSTTKRWASAALVIGSTVAVLASPLAIGTAAAATPHTDTAVSIDPSSQNQVLQAGSLANLAVHYTTSGTFLTGDSVPTIYLTFLNGPDATPANTNPKAIACATTAPANNTSTGTATCSFTNGGTAGVDNVEAFADNNGTTQLDPTAPADVTSSQTTVTFSGHPTAVSISAASSIATAGTCDLYTITATDALGHPAVSENITVTLNETVSGLSPATPTAIFYAPDCATVIGSSNAFTPGTTTSTVSASQVVQTGSNGTVKVGVAAGNPSTGTGNNVTASYAPTPTVSSSASMTWTPGGANSVTHLTVAPSSTTQYAGTSASFTVTALDNNNSPIQGVQVNRETTSGPDNLTPAVCGTTIANGTTTCTVQNGGASGTDGVTFWVDNTLPGSHTTGPDANEPQNTATAVFNPQPTVTSSSLTCVDQKAGATQGQPVGGATHCTLSTAQKSVTFTATLKNGTTPVSGAVINFNAVGAVLGGQVVTGANLPSGTATTGADGTATFTVNNPNAANGDTVSVQAKVGNTSIGTTTADWQAPTASAMTVTPAVQSVTKGGNVAVTVQVTDQFGNGVAATNSINYVVSGRNSKSSNVATDSSGSATISYTDTGTSGTTDLITVADQTNPSLPNGTATVQYINGPATASTVAVDTSGSGTSDSTCALAAHTPATNVALGATTVVCALVKNSAGEALAGRSVKFSVSSGQVAKHGGLTASSPTSVTVVTDALGVAFADVTSTKSGAQTVTAAVDGISGSNTVGYAAPTADKARNVAVAPSPVTVTAGQPQKFTATVTDAFGNPVGGVTVLFTQSGPGNIGGSSSASPQTGSDGTASVTLTTASTDSGSGSVVANITSSPVNQCGQAANAGSPPAATAGNCTATATYTVNKIVPASLLIQVAGAHKVGSQELIAATVKNSDGTPAVNQLVRFTVGGANSASGSGVTTPKGVAFIAYTPTRAGTDHIAAYDDVNNNSAKDVGEPSGTLSVSILSSAKERPTIRLTSSNGHVTVHVTSHPSLAHAVVTYYIERLGVFHAIGTNQTGSAGLAHMSFRKKVGEQFTFRARVGGKNGVKAGTSAAKSIRVRA